MYERYTQLMNQQEREKKYQENTKTAYKKAQSMWDKFELHKYV